jgi:acetyl/propionyl-CoA carboxylase alpha subunit
MPRYTVTVNGREFDITLEYQADRIAAEVDGKKRNVTVYRLQDSRSLLSIDNQSIEVDVRTNGSPVGSGQRVVFMRGREIPVTVEDYALARMRKAAGMTAAVKVETSFRAPMPGLVVKIEVQPGQTVVEGQPLVVIEAMKMENVLKARHAGVVKAVPVAPGQSVEKGDTLVEFE